MSYEIIITETRLITKTVGKEWVKVGEREVPRERNYYAHDKDEPKTRLEAVYDYSPLTEKTVEEKREVLSCVVDELDIKAVLKAIHGL